MDTQDEFEFADTVAAFNSRMTHLADCHLQTIRLTGLDQMVQAREELSHPPEPPKPVFRRAGAWIVDQIAAQSRTADKRPWKQSDEDDDTIIIIDATYCVLEPEATENDKEP